MPHEISVEQAVLLEPVTQCSGIQHGDSADGERTRERRPLRLDETQRWEQLYFLAASAVFERGAHGLHLQAETIDELCSISASDEEFELLAPEWADITLLHLPRVGLCVHDPDTGVRDEDVVDVRGPRAWDEP